MNESDQYWTDMHAKMQRNGGLTTSERGEIRERYLAEQMKNESFTAKKGQVLSKEDPNNMPRHMVPDACGTGFEECPLCFKCRGYDSKFMTCRSCPLAVRGLICKTELHTPAVLNMMIRRERIDLDVNAKHEG